MAITKIVLECNVPSCSRVFKGTVVDAETAGWNEVRPCRDNEPSAHHGHLVTGRTYLGFCPACSKKYGVKGKA